MTPLSDKAFWWEMDTYILSLFVSLEQELAIRELFAVKGWNFVKKGDEDETVCTIKQGNVLEQAGSKEHPCCLFSRPSLTVSLIKTYITTICVTDRQAMEKWYLRVSLPRKYFGWILCKEQSNGCVSVGYS